MSDTRIELDLYPPGNGSVAPEQVIVRLSEAGFFGAVNRAETDAHSVQVHLLAESSDQGLLVPTLRGEPVVLTNEKNFEAFIEELARSLEVSVSGASQTLDVVHYAEGPHGDTESTDDAEVEDAVTRRVVFATYGEDRFPAVSTEDHLTPLAHDVSMNISAPVTAVEATSASSALDPTFLFAEGLLAPPALWANYRPVVEVQYDDGISLRWFSADRATSGVRERLLDLAAPQNRWYLSSDHFYGEPFVPLVQQNPTENSEVDATADALFRSQARLTEQLIAEYSVQAPDPLEVLELTRAIGLPDASGYELAQLLSIHDRKVEITEICAALHFPQYVAEVLTGERDARALPGAVHVEKGTLTGSSNLKALLERPAGDSLTDRMRRLDFDRPALALAIEVGMVTAGIALILLGIMDVGAFEQTWVAVVGYLVGTWLAIDGIGSIVMWTKIRQQERK